MNKWLELLIGLILVIVPIVVAMMNYGGLGFGRAAIEFLKGGIIIGVILIGLLFLMLGISDLKS